jgi:hypothetical protein
VVTFSGAIANWQSRIVAYKAGFLEILQQNIDARTSNADHARQRLLICGDHVSGESSAPQRSLSYGSAEI